MGNQSVQSLDFDGYNTNEYGSGYLADVLVLHKAHGDTFSTFQTTSIILLTSLTSLNGKRNAQLFITTEAKSNQIWVTSHGRATDKLFVTCDGDHRNR